MGIPLQRTRDPTAEFNIFDLNGEQFPTHVAVERHLEALAVP
jgi:hypothetical protein